MSHVRNLLHRPVGHAVNVSAELPPQPPNHSVEDRDVPRNAIHAKTVPEHADLGRGLLNVPVLHAHIEAASRLVCHTDPRSPGADRYRLLRMRLRERAHAGNLKTILITSALPQDGKTTVTMNLATVLSERGKKAVLVIEGDLHRPCLRDRLCVSTSATLTECLQESLNPISALERIEPLGWYFLSAGEPRKNATELLQSPVLAGLLQKVSPYFDWILIDSPPAVSITDALLLQQHADASLLVVRAGQTPQATVEQAVELLGRQKLLGVILNGVSKSKKNRYGYYYSKASSKQVE